MMKKEKLAFIGTALVEILGYCILLGKTALVKPGNFTLALFLYPVTAIVTFLGVWLMKIAFIEEEGSEAKATGVGITSLGVCLQLGLFVLLGAVEGNVIHDAIIAIGGFGFGQYIFVLFKPIVKSHRPGSDYGS